MNFSHLGLDKWLLTNLKFLQYKNPTEIQKRVIPSILDSVSKENIIGISKTGTGKTASFVLPILNKLAMDPSGVFALILEPTRELAVQVVEQLKVFSAGFNLRISMIIGGEDITDQIIKMDNIPHIIVATPGRLCYLLANSYFQFKFIENLQFLVLDEFDQLLNDTIINDIKFIISKLPKERQTFFFSATINYNWHTKEFFRSFYEGKEPITIDCGENENIDKSIKTADNLTEKYILVPNKTKEHYLLSLLQTNYKKKTMIIFVASCKQAHYLNLFLELFDMKVSSIHSKMPQRKRFEAIEKFKARLNPILVATDIASRGLDIPTVELILNYDLPRDPDDYIHRVGRTARAGQKGESLSFVSQYDIELILAIEENSNKKMEELKISEEDILENLSLISKGIKIVQMKMFETGFNEKIDKRKLTNFKKTKK